MKEFVMRILNLHALKNFRIHKKLQIFQQFWSSRKIVIFNPDFDHNFLIKTMLNLSIENALFFF